MANMFRMSFNVSEEDVNIVMEVVKGAAHDLTLEQVHNKAAHRKAPVIHRNAETSVLKLQMDRLKEGPVTLDELMKIIEAKGYNKTSASPAINSLVREGKVKRWINEKGRPTFALK